MVCVQEPGLQDLRPVQGHAQVRGAGQNETDLRQKKVSQDLLILEILEPFNCRCARPGLPVAAACSLCGLDGWGGHPDPR